MKTCLTILLALWTIFIPGAQGQQPPATAPPPLMPMVTMSGLLRLVQTIPLPTEGYMDHIAVDVKGQRLFITGEANRSIVVVGLREGKVIHVTNGRGGNTIKPFYLHDINVICTVQGDN